MSYPVMAYHRHFCSRDGKKGRHTNLELVLATSTHLLHSSGISLGPRAVPLRVSCNLSLVQTTWPSPHVVMSQCISHCKSMLYMAFSKAHRLWALSLHSGLLS